MMLSHKIITTQYWSCCHDDLTTLQNKRPRLQWFRLLYTFLMENLTAEQKSMLELSQVSAETNASVVYNVLHYFTLVQTIFDYVQQSHRNLFW